MRHSRSDFRLPDSRVVSLQPLLRNVAATSGCMSVIEYSLGVCEAAFSRAYVPLSNRYPPITNCAKSNRYLRRFTLSALGPALRGPLTERLGFAGREEGIAAMASVLLIEP